MNDDSSDDDIICLDDVPRGNRLRKRIKVEEVETVTPILLSPNIGECDQERHSPALGSPEHQQSSNRNVSDMSMSFLDESMEQEVSAISPEEHNITR